MALLRIERPDGGVRRLVLAQQGAQGTAAQMLSHVVVGQLTESDAAQCRVQHRPATVAAPVALYPYFYLAPGLGKAPRVTAADKTVVPGQLGQAVRCAVVVQISWSGAQIHAPRCQAGGDQPGVLQPSEADGPVALAMPQVRRLAGQGHLDAQPRASMQDVADQPHEELLAVR